MYKGQRSEIQIHRSDGRLYCRDIYGGKIPVQKELGTFDEVYEREKQKLRLSVYVKNQAAVRFYQREDFQIRTEGVDEATGEAEYEMTWER